MTAANLAAVLAFLLLPAFAAGFITIVTTGCTTTGEAVFNWTLAEPQVGHAAPGNSPTATPSPRPSTS